MCFHHPCPWPLNFTSPDPWPLSFGSPLSSPSVGRSACGPRRARAPPRAACVVRPRRPTSCDRPRRLFMAIRSTCYGTKASDDRRVHQNSRRESRKSPIAQSARRRPAAASLAAAALPLLAPPFGVRPALAIVVPRWSLKLVHVNAIMLHNFHLDQHSSIGAWRRTSTWQSRLCATSCASPP